MRTLTNTQINKITNVVYNVLSKKFEEKGIDMTHISIINNTFKNKLTNLIQKIEEDTKLFFENESYFEYKKLIEQNIKECIEYCFMLKDSNFEKFEELIRLVKDEEEEEEEEDENGNIIVISSEDVYDYDYNSTIRDFNDSYFHNQILKVDNLDKKDEENSDFLFQGLHLNFDNTCNILTLQTSKNYKEQFIDLKIEEINFDTNNHKNFSISTEQLKEIFFNEFDRRYELDSEDFEEIYEYSLSKIKAVLNFLEEEIEERVEARNAEENELKK